MRFNVGSFSKVVHLLQPSTPSRDSIGGINEIEFKTVGTVRALQRDKTTTYKQVIGDYVTVNTAYFIVRDLREAYTLDVDWRLKIDGATYIINTISLLDDSRPYFMEIEATRIGGIN